MGQDVTRWSQPRRAQAGLGRSYQRTTIFPNFTVRENCRLSAQAKWQKPWDWFTPAKRCDSRHPRPSARCSAPGWHRWPMKLRRRCLTAPSASLKSRCAWRPRPQILLLDEPLAGMGSEETERMLVLLNELKTSHAILLVEHDMDAVFRVSDRITVMVNGRVLASDTPQAIRANAEVQEAYLGAHEERVTH